MAFTIVNGVQYSGMWTLEQATNAVAAGTWPAAPTPKLFSWGRNNVGQLGLGTSGGVATYKSSPNQVGALTTWLKISTGYSSAYAIKTDGTLWSWGSNGDGQLGLNNRTNYSSPKQIGALTNWSKISGGVFFVTAIKIDGTLWSWGANNYGQLGIGNITYYSSPKQVGSLTDWLVVSSQYRSVLAVKTNGTLWAWGYNPYGNLGLNNRTSYSSPKQVGSLTNWLSVTSNYFSTFAVKTDGTLWSWGNNAQGALGLGNTTSYSSPKQVGSLTNWSSNIACGYQSAFAIKTDGTLWSWGNNANGALGLGNLTNYSSPKQVGSLTNWSNISYPSYGENVLALKTDGTLWSWGYNSTGALGLGNTTNYSSPKQIGALTGWTTISSGSRYALAIAATV